MVIKLTANLSNPPISGLATALLINGTHPVEVEWGSETCLLFASNEKLVCHSNNDVLRALAREAPDYQLYGSTAIERTQIDHWLSFSLTCDDDILWTMSYLEKCIAPVTFLVSNKLTIADFALFNEMHSRYDVLVKNGIPTHVQRWYNLILAQPLIQKVIQTLPAEAKVLRTDKRSASKEKEPKTGERKQEGKFVDLPGAEMGKVIVRFPPEASGFLHIGHAKAALLNQYYQQAFQGKLIMRFDDTNPAKENAEFEKVILEDLKMLEIEPDLFTHTSQYFDLMLEYCETLMKEGRAYVDDTDPVTMKTEREQRIESTNRSNSVEKNFGLWKEMVAGTARGQQCCVRAKIDMNSPNGCLRDPTIYRCKNEPHPRTGTQYKVYPTYDFACPIVDAIENVTHTLRTMEYHDRDDQFYWFIDALKLRKPYIWEYSRLNMTNTVLSKRKLTWFVEQGLVDGWDDPRFPTVRGILRRGMTVEGLREFIIAQGSSKSVVFMNWDKIWAFNKKVIDPIAPRYTALEIDNPVVVNVTGAKKESFEVAAHPKNDEVGKKTVWIGPEILIDRADAEALKEGENATFINWGNLLIKKINKENGKIMSIDADLNLDNKDFKKTLKLTWLCKMEPEVYPPTFCVYFEHIISKAVLGKDEDFKQYIGHETRSEVKMLGDPELKKCKKGDIIQLQRRGFFKVDNAYKPPSVFTGVISPIVLFSIPDGHTKEMPTSGSKKQAATESSDKKLSSNQASDIDAKITAQGEIVRDLKAQKAPKEKVTAEVQALLALKAEYKAATGQDWKPGTTAPAPGKSAASAAPVANKGIDIDAKISAQGDLVRDLKAQKAPKDKVTAEVQTLLALKAEYKLATGQDWKPGTAAAPATTPAAATNCASEIDAKIKVQGERVRLLKVQKAPKDKVTAEVQTLLALKAEFKTVTGQEWKPTEAAKPTQAAQPTDSNSKADEINGKIKAQGDAVRDLKAQKAAKDQIQSAVNLLLSLKTEYKAATGQDWKPSAQPDKTTTAPAATGAAKTTAAASTTATASTTAATSTNGSDLDAKINAQGDIIRDLKAKKAPKTQIDLEVQSLLSLKAQYKTATGKDWKPGSQQAIKTATVAASNKQPASDAGAINLKIANQGDIVRDLKSQKVPKERIDTEIKNLLNLKAEYKAITGQDWKPAAATQPAKAPVKEIMAPAAGDSDKIKTELTQKVNAQGELVRQLKTDKATKEQVDAAVATLLALKAEYKSATGTDFPVAARTPLKPKTDGGAKPKPKKEAPKPKPAVDPSKESAVKKVTRLGLEATKEDNLPEWYSQVITKGELIEYYDVSGCYILRHWSFAIWKTIKNWFDAEITKLGVKECYFPIFVSRAALEKEKTHIADFAPEVAWVTRSGDSELAEPIAVRPTSETVMYPAFAKWIQSYRDLPIRLNQWNNVVRWEFKHPQPFLRTREFLWQEGHTAYAVQKDAEDEVLTILDLYGLVYTHLLAIPVIKGKKTEKEKFAGGDYTTTVEAFISASGRAIQGATSHHLGQNFSKMFDIVYEDPETQQKQHVFQNSWGLTTRTIGVMIMVHADNQGLVLPPHVACIQAIIVPCGITVNMKDAEREELLQCCKNLEKTLLGNEIRAEGDYRDNYSPGWKFNHWELKGVPVRIEIGPKDMKNKQVVAVRRDTGEKLTIPMAEADKKVAQLLETIHESMLAKATRDLTEHTKVTKSWDEFCQFLDTKNIIMSPFCSEEACEDKIKADSARDQDIEPGAPAMGAKSLCIPFEQPAKILPNDKCVHPACSNKPKYYTLFGRSY